jgi:hypothetical protein
MPEDLDAEFKRYGRMVKEYEENRLTRKVIIVIGVIMVSIAISLLVWGYF